MPSPQKKLYTLLEKHGKEFHPVIKFNPANQKLISFDFTKKNTRLAKINLQNVEEFSKYISDELKTHKANFGFGGYGELRILYNRSELFNKDLSGKNDDEEPRRLHIGIDIWGSEGTEVFAPLDGKIHSFAFNNNFGDYGATIIMEHQLEGVNFFTLYGHLSIRDIDELQEGKTIRHGSKFAHLGNTTENGHWPPHLHFQVIENISIYKGDYPGVCKLSERKIYLENCPDPDVILNMRKYLEL